MLGNNLLRSMKGISAFCASTRFGIGGRVDRGTGVKGAVGGDRGGGGRGGGRRG